MPRTPERDAPDGDAEETAARLADFIRNGRARLAMALFNRLAEQPYDLEGRLPGLRAAARQAGALDLLFRLFLNADPGARSRLRLIATAVGVGIECGQTDAALRLLRRTRKREDGAALRFGLTDLVGRVCAIGELERGFRKPISTLKYRGLSIDRPEDIFEAAERLAQRIDFPPALQTRLFEHRADRSVDFPAWRRRLGAGAAMAHITYERPRAAIDETARPFTDLVDVDQRRAVVDQVEAAGGLLITFHGGLIHLAVDLFTILFPKGLVLRTGAASGALSLKDDVAGPLFRAVRAASRGTPIFMGGDGRQGNLKRTVEVLGKPVAAADGGAFIAYEARRPTFWYTVVPDGRRLEVMLAQGPTVKAGEGFPAFAERWSAFYWSKLEEALSGPPASLSLFPPWADLSAWDQQAPPSSLEGMDG